MSELRDTASALARRRLWVFPVSGKIPITDNGFLDAVGSADEACGLFSRFPRATGIGIDCGRSGLLVIDIDGPDGESAWDTLTAEHGRTQTLEVCTGRSDGGRHLWLRTRDARSRSSTRKLGSSLHTRGVGGYVLAPPSVHPSGRRYSWATSRPIADAPEWLLERLAPPPPPPIGEHRTLPICERLTTYGRVALDGLADRMLSAPEGTRNETLLEVARRAGRLEAAGELDASLAEAVLVQAALHAGLPQIEADKTFRSAFEFGRQFPAARAAR